MRLAVGVGVGRELGAAAGEELHPERLEGFACDAHFSRRTFFFEFALGAASFRSRGVRRLGETRSGGATRSRLVGLDAVAGATVAVRGFGTGDRGDGLVAAQRFFVSREALSVDAAGGVSTP